MTYDLRQTAEGAVYDVGIRKDFCYVRFQYDNVTSACIALRVLSTDALRKIVSRSVHLLRDAVGMDLAGAEDDDLLLRTAVLAEQLEQVGAHRGGAHVDEQFVIKVLAGVFGPCEVFFA